MPRVFVRYPASTVSGAALLVLTCLYWMTGTLFPSELPSYADSSLEITGMALMLILQPAYLLGMYFVTRRRSLELVDQLETRLSDPNAALEARSAIRTGLKRTWPYGCVIGLVMGQFNTPVLYAFTESTAKSIDISISLGQLFMWLIIGLLFSYRALCAMSFSRLGECVEIELFQLDRLRPLARSGMIDVLVIAGALALSPLQALDAEFRWYNYSFALAVSIPSALLYFVLPLRRVHQRIQREKESQIARLDALVEAAARDQATDGLARFETLLAHRERVRTQPTWPLSTALLSRLLIYLIIPPLAWVGAAIVESFVTGLIER